MSPKKSFCVYATTSREKTEWMTHINSCIEKLSNRKAFDPMKSVEVAPQWIPDKEADICMRCRHAKFTVVNRRVFIFINEGNFLFYYIYYAFIMKHHCRNCGYVICGDCSKNKFMIPSQSDEPLRVCNSCYAILSNNTAGIIDQKG